MAYDPNFQVKPEQRRVVVQPEKTIDGTQFNFRMSPVSVIFVGKDQKLVGDVTVSFLNGPARVAEIMADAQPPCRVLQAGDMILRVGDREIRDARAFRSASRSYHSGESFEVTYRRKGSDEDLHFTASGGRPMGIKME